MSAKKIKEKNVRLIHVRIPIALDNKLQKAQIETGYTISKIVRMSLERNYKISNN